MVKYAICMPESMELDGESFKFGLNIADSDPYSVRVLDDFGGVVEDLVERDGWVVFLVELPWHEPSFSHVESTCLSGYKRVLANRIFIVERIDPFETETARRLGITYDIMIAALYGDVSLVKLMLERGMSITDDAVISALERGNLDVFRFFVENYGEMWEEIRESEDYYVTGSKDVEVIEYATSVGAGVRVKDLMYLYTSGSSGMRVLEHLSHEYGMPDLVAWMVPLTSMHKRNMERKRYEEDEALASESIERVEELVTAYMSENTYA